jgi:pimeloyl-ACP methyl ester carboxylesterase
MTIEAKNKAIERPEWLPRDVWSYEIQSVVVDGTPIAYTDEGTGQVLLLIHDGMWSYVWGQLIGALRGRFRVVTLDFPGSGLSPESSAHPPGLNGDSMLVEAFVEKLGIEKATVVAHDVGGAVGVGFAARRPDVVDGLVLVNTFAWPPHVASLTTMFRVMTSWPVRALNTGTNLVPKLTSGKSGIGRHLDAPARQAFLGGFRDRATRHRFHDMMAAVRNETDYLAQIEESLSSTLSEKPALTIYGEKNDPFGFQEKFAEYLTDVEEMIIPGGNHFPMADDPQGVAQRIASWHEEKLQA